MKVDIVTTVRYDIDYDSIGYDSPDPTFTIFVGINTQGEYHMCSEQSSNDYSCGHTGYLVLLLKGIHKRREQSLALCEVLIYGSPFSDPPCLSKPCGNGGTCEPKANGFYRCVCPQTWPGLNCEGKNWARGQNATISGPKGTVIAASNTVDGNRDHVMRYENIDHQCVTTTSGITSPWWKVELGNIVEVTQVFMVNRVDNFITNMLKYVVVVGPYNGTYTTCSARNIATVDNIHYDFAWMNTWCRHVVIGSTVKITYTHIAKSWSDIYNQRLSLCEVEVYGILKPCASSPCSNGGTCHLVGNTENIRSYECSCQANSTGTNCETTDPCKSNPCYNGGTCKWNDTLYTCVCHPNSTGSNCETIDPCLSNPCDYGGTCKWNDTSYICLCPSKWKWNGTNCERTKYVKTMPIATKVLIGVGVTLGVAAVGAGAVAATSSTWCTTVTAAYTADFVSKLGVVTAMKTASGLTSVTAMDSEEEDDDDDDEEEEDEDEEDEEQLAILDA